jgi:hypothetical protein
MESLIATNLVLIFVAAVGWTGFFILAYALMNVHPREGRDED